MALAACTSTNAPPWTVLTQSEPAPLLSVWAASDSDVYVVGEDRKDNTGPIVEHFDGTAWTHLDAVVRNVNLWWTFGFANGPVFMGGTNGTIVRYQNGVFETMTTPGVLTVFGIWGAAPDDVWAVGGNFSGGAFAWHYDGSVWTASTQIPSDITMTGTIWKVGGRSSTDLWMSGTNGAMLHWNGSSLDRTDILVEGNALDGSLFSVAGNAERFITVGQAAGAVIYENSGTDWTPATITGNQNQDYLTGVAVSEDQAYAVGNNGLVVSRGDSGWAKEPSVTPLHLHGAFIDSAGGAWAVGGDFDSQQPMTGVLIHKGNPVNGSVP